jgi:hypothetical protein
MAGGAVLSLELTNQQDPDTGKLVLKILKRARTLFWDNN